MDSNYDQAEKWVAEFTDNNQCALERTCIVLSGSFGKREALLHARGMKDSMDRHRTKGWIPKVDME